ncbi:MAG: serine protease [Spirochaetaceae bacterium]|nr:serine protease [Spirochaetaceae bacterium]
MKKQFLIFIPLLALFFSCRSQQISGSAGFSPKLQTLVRDAVFEVVLKKPEEKNVVYDKKLDWQVIPYAIRNDAYYSIGTAFSISATEAITAFHVIDLSNESDVFKDYYIRDSGGNVYEVDNVIKASNEKDFLVFTVKDKTFSSWFELDPVFSVSSQVYSIGNALGEGIVVRNGLVLGTVPEEEEGRWNLLKSSADGNPGNSGGPLVTPEGKAVGVVIALRDNILYSLPVSEVLSTPSATTHFRSRATYGHLLLANHVDKVFEADAALPAPYKKLRNTIFEAYKIHYPTAMEQVFAEAPVYLEGPNNRYILNQTVSSDFPEFAFVDKNDDQWKISDLEVRDFALDDDGLILEALVSGFYLIKLRRPKSASLEQLNTNPKAAMDMVLSGISMERTLGNTGKYRILSFGEPVEVSEYRDRQGRIWNKAWWLLDFEDSIILTYILPMPNGPVIFMTRQNSSDRHIYEWDMEATCDRIVAAYRGDMQEWNEFLSLKKWIPSSLEQFSLNWDETKKSVSLRFPHLSFTADNSVFDWTSQSTLFMAPAYYQKDDGIEYGFRSLIVQRDIKGNDYFMIYQHIKPDERLGVKNMEYWNDVVAAKYPFDGISRLSAKDNTGSTGGLLSQVTESPDVRYSLYLNVENPGDEDALARRYKTLEGGISISR